MCSRIRMIRFLNMHVMDEVMFGPLNIGMSREEAEQKSLAALENLDQVCRHLAEGKSI